MKKIFVVLVLCLTFVAQAQEPASQKAYIEVTGTAETEAAADLAVNRADGNEEGQQHGDRRADDFEQHGAPHRAA